MSEVTSLKRPAAPRSPEPPKARGLGPVLARVVDFLASFRLAVTLLLLLTGLVFVSTLAQRSMGLFDVQEKYYSSFVWFWGFLPLPGGALLLGLLGLNLLVGGLIRIRKKTATAGVMIAHVGILVLLLGGFVESLWSDRGYLSLWEGETGGSFRSYYDWEIAIARRQPDGKVREFVLPHDRLQDLDEGDTARFVHADLPFDVVVSGWQRNAAPRLAAPAEAAIAVEGVVLEALDPEKDAEHNTPGAVATLVSKTGAPSQRGLLHGVDRDTGAIFPPWVVSVEGAPYEVSIRKRTWDLPFSLHLKKFVKRDHPGTSMPAEFSSYVTKVEHGVARDVHITMNEPLRHRGYTFYQSGWGPQNDPIPKRWQSVFSVVRNPSDQVPWAAIGIITLGLLVHFGMKLFRFVKVQTARWRASRPAALPAEGRS